MVSSTSHPAWHDPLRLAVLWAGILTGPLVWLAMLEVNYLLTYVACESGHKWFMHLTVLVAVAIVAAAGCAAERNGALGQRRRDGNEPLGAAHGPGDRLSAPPVP